jgi:amidophosphoribosyltransferase
VEGKRVVLVDDSIVRGTTSRKIVRMLREAGAKEIHVRVSSPPTMHTCHYGIDTPTRRELIASSHSVVEIRSFIEADSLGYLSAEGDARSVRPAAAGRLHRLLHRDLSRRGRREEREKESALAP